MTKNLTNNDINYMREALCEATKAYNALEIPVGAVIVNEFGEIVGRGYNLKETTKVPILHAEIVAILNAHKIRKKMYLSNCTIYTTLEPCPMCAAALVNERISHIVYALEDMKYGACGSAYNLVSDNKLNHRILVRAGVLREESLNLIKRFFNQLRNKINEV
ncbi:MAG: nucleoside deaminase [Deltaproteobacteria bacterium]|nr:nucleoside deaminase [Deltaproteobacteria bacterium]